MIIFILLLPITSIINPMILFQCYWLRFMFKEQGRKQSIYSFLLFFLLFFFFFFGPEYCSDSFAAEDLISSCCPPGRNIWRALRKRLLGLTSESCRMELIWGKQNLLKMQLPSCWVCSSFSDNIFQVYIHLWMDSSVQVCSLNVGVLVHVSLYFH